MPSKTDEDVWFDKLEQLLEKAQADFNDGHYRRSESTLKKALEFSSTHFGPKDLNTALILNRLGMTYKYLSKYKDAIKVYRASLDIVRKQLRPNDPLLASLYHNLGGLEHSQGHFALGEIYARESVRIRKKTCSADDPALAEDLAGLAAILRERGKLGQAKKILLQVLPIFRKHAKRLPRHHYDVAINANNLAAIYADMEQYELADKMYREALEVKQRILRAGHPDIAITLNNLAMLCSRQRKFDEAKQLQQRCLKILKESVGQQHPKYLAALSNSKRIANEAQNARLSRIIDGPGTPIHSKNSSAPPH